LKSSRALHGTDMLFPTFTSIRLQDLYLLSTHLHLAVWRFSNA
jgi:hypothetical protein